MRERITFLYAEGGAVDPKSLTVEETALSGPTIEAIREDKLTLNVRELPSDVAETLSHLDELHLRWASPLGGGSGDLEPFCSRLSPGLHVSYTPAAADPDPAALCNLLQAFGPLDCASPEAFTDFREGRHGDTAALYFYHELENLDAFAIKASSVLCAAEGSSCHERTASLKTATGLDASFDSASGALKISASWPLQRHSISASSSPLRRTEVGILGRDVPPNPRAHEISVSGLLTVVGDSKEPSVTLFSFPSRHRIASGSFSANFSSSPTGMHPALGLSVHSQRPEGARGGDDGDDDDDDDECRLYAYLTLPKAIFADRYQLADELFLASKNLSAAPYVSQPVDLEAPAYTTKTWGSNVLVQLSQQHAQVPLHLRYLKPSQTGMAEIEVPYPVVFWACEAAGDVDLGNNPFDRLQLGYDGLFERSTVFWHVRPETAGGRLMSRVAVPVLASEAAEWVGVGTAVAVGLGFLWVLMKLFGGSRGDGSAEMEKKRKEKKEKKQK